MMFQLQQGWKTTTTLPVNSCTYYSVCARHRVTASLEHPTAFVPTVKFGAKGSSRVDRRGILPAALFIEGVLQELAEWAQAMPGFKNAFNGRTYNVCCQASSRVTPLLKSVVAIGVAQNLLHPRSNRVGQKA